MSIREAYDPATRWGRAFGYVDWSVYTNGWHRAQDIRKLDPTGSYSVATDVVSLSAGRVSHTFTGKVTGREVVVDTGRGRGRYEIHCHSAYFPRVGLEVGAGDVLTRNANATQQPGTGWSGPHDHFLISDFPDAAHVASRPVYDPRDFIRSALASAAGGDGRPFDPEEDDMYTDADRVRDEMIAKRLRGPENRDYDMLQSIEGIVSQVLIRIRGPLDRNYDMLQSIEGLAGNRPAAELGVEDRDAIAAAIVAAIPSVVANLSPESLEVVARSVNDERDRRERERLAG